ncbi:hypothetical protein EJB05_01924, partial [Eragrostis curvula]
MAHEIEHAHIPVRGLNLHIAQAGNGELGTVVFLHGFPEIWYTWRHQMLAAAAAGYRAVAPDWRGYGLSEQPPESELDWDDLVADVLAVLDALAVDKAFVVGKDFGSIPAFYFALRHPERTRGVASLGIPFSPGPFDFAPMPEGFYILRWREPGRAEADFGRYDVRRVVRTIYILFSSPDVPIAKEGQEIMDLVDDESAPLPDWFTETDLDAYASLYQNSGFRCSLQMYRALHKMPHLPDAKFQVPVLMVMGEKDYCNKFPGFEDTVRSGAMGSFAPDMKTVFIPEGSHFMQEQMPEQVNKILLGFFNDKTAVAA